MTIYSYTRPSGGNATAHETQTQRNAVKLIASLQGIAVSNGSWVEELSASSEVAISQLVKRLHSGDTLIFASPSVLDHRPSKMLEIALALQGAGVRLICASAPGGAFPFETLRASMEPLQQLERQVVALQKQIEEERDEHAADFAKFQVALEKQLTEFLAAKGVTLSNLIKPSVTLEGGTVVARPDEGKRIRALREALSMTGEEAGRLLEPHLSKAAVSRIESAGSAEPRFAELRDALTIEEVMKADADRKRLVLGINPQYGQDVPFSESEEAIAAQLVNVAS